MSRQDAQPPLLSLQALAELPLHRQVWSAALADASGRLGTVGGVTAKDQAAHRQGLKALGVATGQTLDNEEVLALRSPTGLPVDQAATLQQALALVHLRSHSALYGSITELPDVLRLADAAGTPDPHASFDYTRGSYFAFGSLNELIDQRCLRAAAQSQLPGDARPDQAAELPDGEPLKLMTRGYLFILGTAGCGKTSFALEWVRHSQAFSLRPPGADQRPRLAGWYFARRYSTDGSGAGRAHLDEYRALQTWLAMARRQRDVLPQADAVELFSDTELSTYTGARGSSDWFKLEDTLRERFSAGLRHLADAAASAADPIVLLLDGADEMWAPGPQTIQVRHAFPRLLPLPKDLPEHVYIVVLSRPGAHMQWSQARPPVQPILQYTFKPDRVARFIQAYLQQQAAALRPTDLQAAQLLEDPVLQRHIAEASEGAFGYAALLLRPWLRPGLGEQLLAQRLQQLERWRSAPSGLPRGVYGLRARDLLDADRGLAQELARDPALAGQTFHSAPAVSVTELLATLAVLRAPMTRRDLEELWCSQPGDAQQLRRVLAHGFSAAAPFLAGGSSDGVLQFGHQSLAEVALAAWRLSAQGQPQAYGGATDEQVAALARYMADQRLQRRRADLNGEAEPGNPTDYSDEELLAADARLHGRIAQRCQRWWRDQVQPPADKPWLKKAQRIRTAQAYALAWGPLHALMAATDMGVQHLEPEPLALGLRARAMLIDAPYLQAAIRAQAAHPLAAEVDASALRLAYVQADKLPGEDPDRSLRHRVESAVLEWYQHIASGAAQVGGVLWNLLGADELGQALAEAWKASLDEPALITERPGTSSVFARMIPAKMSAVTECGDWLVTSDGQTYTEVWDLRDGWHRAVVNTKVDWAVHSNLCVCTDGQIVGVGGIAIGNEAGLALGWIQLDGGGAPLAQYAGHRSPVTSVALGAAYGAHGRVTHLALASGSWDATVGLLLRSPEQVVQDAGGSIADPQWPNPGLLTRYAGHRGQVHSIALHAATTRQGELTHWALASGSDDGTVGLLLRGPEQVLLDAEPSSPDSKSPPKMLGRRHDDRRLSWFAKDLEPPNPGLLARYSGHQKWVDSIALRAATTPQGEVTQWALASGSGDGTVGLLLRTPQQVLEDAEQSSAHPESPNPGLLARYDGYREFASIALHAATTPLGQVTYWALASGSTDDTVGLLLRSPEQVVRDAERSFADQKSPNPGLQARYTGHREKVNSVALRAATTSQGEVTHWALASVSDDKTVGLLLRSPEQVLEDAERRSSDSRRPNPGVLARYAGHRERVNSVILRATTTSQGEFTYWALASGSDDGTAGVLLRSNHDVLQDAEQSSTDPQSPNARMLARYAGHTDGVMSIALTAASTPPGQGHITQWALASGSKDCTVGLLVRSPQQVLQDAGGSSANREFPNHGVCARYTGHGGAVWSVALSAASTPQGQVTHWALASGSSDQTVGLLLRSPHDVLRDAERSAADPQSRNQKLLARYSGFSTPVSSVALLAATTPQGEVTHWALASGSSGGNVGLLSRSPQQVLQDAEQSSAHLKYPNPGLLAQYSGHDERVVSVALRAATTSHGEVIHWALASGSEDKAVGLLMRSPQQVLQDAERSSADRQSRNWGMLARYAGHHGRVDSIALHAAKSPQGHLTDWALASGSLDHTVGLWTMPREDSLHHTGGNDATRATLFVSRQTGRPRFVHLTATAPPGCHSDAFQAADEKLHWLGGDSGVAFIWRSTPSTGLQVQFACPYYSQGFNAMDFAQAPDRMQYMVGGSVGNDVALLPLRLFDPASPEPT